VNNNRTNTINFRGNPIPECPNKSDENLWRIGNSKVRPGCKVKMFNDSVLISLKVRIEKFSNMFSGFTTQKYKVNIFL